MNIKLRTFIVGISIATLLSGCAGLFGPSRHQRSSSIADYLYPKSFVVREPSIPTLRLPLKVGVAFVPGDHTPVSYSSDATLSEMNKARLLERVATRFRSQNFVGSVEVVPSAYLRHEGGFENLDQLRRMLGIDVVILVGYDQLQFTDENLLSLSYWTIVGAYVINGNRNDTHTLVEAAVYDIESRNLLFRAPGTSQVAQATTAMDAERQRRKDSEQGLSEAMDVLIGNLDKELQQFRAEAKKETAPVRIEYRSGFIGGGSSDLFLLGILALASIYGIVSHRRRT